MNGLERSRGGHHLRGMNRRDTTSDAACATRADGDLELLPSALRIAADEYPDLDVAATEAEIRKLARGLADRVDARAPVEEKLAALNRYLFEEQGFSGNHDDFYDPRNSYLNEVMARRLGIPVSLAVLQIECARALDLPLQGVSFPGHFLVRLPMDDGILVLDPYHRGRPVGIDELRLRVRSQGSEEDVDDRQLLHLLAPASNRTIVGRMLRNLKAIYTSREEWDKALRCTSRLVELGAGGIEDLRDRGLLYLRLGYAPRAAEDLSRYLQRAPLAEDAAAVREALIEASRCKVRLQ